MRAAGHRRRLARLRRGRRRLPRQAPPGVRAARVTADADTVARTSADAMWAEDGASRGMGMSLDAVGPGRAVLSMTVRADMVNGLGLCHGGYIFSLADSAMAFASNSHGQAAVAQHCGVTFIRPGRAGERLTAEATERGRHGRQGIYDVRVTGEDGTPVAEFRGHTVTMGKRPA
ncbi:MAG: hydroxyphenylacetyl-CoA thioesterase PaaI [Proteobacteria bacterium]|nr:hydroxyphenylacetyl-CoA thioesterase PaaI [Pseudomonadota bacterium]